jgi:hypothetical protein
MISILIAGLDRKVSNAIKGTPAATVKADSAQALKFRQAAVKQAADNEKRYVESSYKRLERDVSSLRGKAPASVKTGKGFVNNLWNIATNAFDNTVGYGIAKYQNFRTKRELRKDPGTKKPIAYLMHGVMQNEGSQWRLARELRKKGYSAYHLKGYHSLPRAQGAEKGFQQIDSLHKYASLKNPSSRKDYFSGHSSGADIGIYMAADPRIKKYGISRVQARAPAPYGIKPVTFGQRILMPLAGNDDLSRTAGKKNAVVMAGKKPHVSVDIVAGTYDKLVTPRNAAYKHADSHYILTDQNSTHFGTSGVNNQINSILVELLTPKGRTKYRTQYIDQYREQYKQAA